MRYSWAKVFLVCLLCQLALQTANGDYTVERSKFLGKLDSWVTSWITTAQFVKILDYMEPLMNSTSTMDELQDEAMSIVMNTLTSSQMMSAVSLGTSFLFSYGGYTQPLNVSMTAVMNNLKPFIAQCVKMKAKSEVEGWTKDRTFTRAYRMINIFFTYRCSNIIFCRTQKNVDAYKSGLWSFITNKMSSMLKFSAQNYTAGNCYP
uniref:Secreted protein n=1 Tax=Panagrellus redivivus TaxID=6233 RepID=A0A7E4VAN1_PANRE